MPVYSCIVYSHFDATVITLSSCNRDYMACKAKQYFLVLYRKILPTFILDLFSYCVWVIRADQKYILYCLWWNNLEHTLSLTHALALILCNFIYSLFVTIEIGFSLKSQFSYQLFVTITEKITNEESSYLERPPSSTSCSLPYLQLYLPLAVTTLSFGFNKCDVSLPAESQLLWSCPWLYFTIPGFLLFYVTSVSRLFNLFLSS